MRVSHVWAKKVSELEIDADIDMGGYSLTDMGNLVLAKNTGIQLLAALAVSGDWCGQTVLATAGEEISQFDTVYLTETEGVKKSDADLDTTMPIKGIAVADVASGASGVFLIEGFIRNDGWNWTVGAFLYADTVAGGVTETTHSGSEDMIQRVGIAVTKDIMWFRPDLTLLEVT